MKRLSRVDEETLGRLTAQLHSAYAHLELMVDGYNQVMAAALAPVEAAYSAYADALLEALNFTQEVVTRQDAYLEQRAISWLNSPMGETYTDWIKEWAAFEGELSEFEPPEMFEIWFTDASEDLENLPRAPGE